MSREQGIATWLARRRLLICLAARENRGVIEYLAIIRSILMHAMNTEAAKGNTYAIERAAGRLLETLAAIGKITGEVTVACLIGLRISFAILHRGRLIRRIGWTR